MNDNIYKLSDFTGRDDTEKFANAMKCLRENPGATLFVQPGTYTITTELAREAQNCVMYAKYGPNPQKVMFRPDYEYSRGIDFAGQKNTTLIGYGVTILVDGFMEPVSIRDCEGVTITGITIRHKRKPYSRGIIHTVGEQNADGTYNCRVELDDDCEIFEETPLDTRQLLWDPVSNQVLHGSFQVEKYQDGHHILGKAVDVKNPEGVEYYFTHTYHARPAILIERAKDITLRDVTINNQPGMGIVGNRSENVLINHLSIIPVEGDHFSTNTDGTHFTSMKGLLRLEDCRFDGMGDDFTNVHTYYHKAVKREGKRVLYLQEKTPDGTHAQSLDYPDVGDTLEMTDFYTMKVADSFKVVSCTPMAEEWMCRVELDHDAPDDLEKLIFSDITRLPRLEVVGCIATNHFARGVLCKCRDALIEGNVFRNIFGPAVELGAEAYWYEGICPANITVRNNIFDRCGQFWGGASGVVVMADSEIPTEKTIFNITIEDNLVYSPEHETGILMRNTKDGKISKNTVISKGEPVVVVCCEDIETEQ